MSALADFVLDTYRLNGALVESRGYGLYDVLLPDALASALGLPALQRLAFDPLDPPSEDVVYLSQGHPWVERLVQWVRRGPAPNRAYINTLRLEKQGLADAARQALGFPNARLVEARGSTQARASCHYVLFTFKVALTTDEKHEHLAAVLMDAQSGWRADAEAILGRAVLEDEATLGRLSLAAPRWTAAENPLAPEALQGLLQRAERHVLEEMAEVLAGVRRRSARYLELDRARLEQYYDDLAGDLDRRLQRASEERRAALQDKLGAVRAEREIKLADAEARYRLRVDLELITAQVIVQPKLVLPRQIENRHISVLRAVVWDPLLRQVEPLACDVCGQPGRNLTLCSGGHLAHERCLLEEQCRDCRRAYCRLCGQQMAVCAVCGRATCLKSLNRCSTCGRGTCHEHVGLCHADGGAPAALPLAGPAAQSSSSSGPAIEPPPAPASAPRPKPKAENARPKRPRPPAPRRETKQPPAPPARVVVQMQQDQPVVVAFVLTTKSRGPAVRTWRLTPEGIGVQCDCEKGRLCSADNKLINPGAASTIEAQIQAFIEQLCQEYDVPARRLSYIMATPLGAVPETRLILSRAWRDESALSLAQAGWQAVYERQYGASRPLAFSWGRRRKLPELTPEQRTEADRLVQAACGLLALEGVLREEDLRARLNALLHPGSWCTPDTLLALLEDDSRLKVLGSGLVASAQVRNVQAMARRKARTTLPPPHADLAPLLVAAEPDPPLSLEEAQLEAELRQVFPRLSLRKVQQMIRNAESPEALMEGLAHGDPTIEAEALSVSRVIARLWQRTPRWELHGRTPEEASAPASSPH